LDRGAQHKGSRIKHFTVSVFVKSVSKCVSFSRHILFRTKFHQTVASEHNLHAGIQVNGLVSIEMDIQKGIPKLMLAYELL
jgi:hypothetical protein